VHCDDDLIVINKPAGVPVHPAGRYRHNSVLNIMSIEHNFASTIAPCNRLDRLTSGLMFFAQHASAAEKMCQYLFDRELTKEYLARVVGNFPDGDIIVDQPLKSVNPMYGLNRVHPDGKPSKSKFRKLSYNGVTSLVWCRPYSGRTHQLRVHLQFLGHPIANDPIYANKRVWGDDLTQANAKSDAEVEDKLLHLGRSQLADFGDFTPAMQEARVVTESRQHEFVTYNTKAESIAKREKRIGELLTGDTCKDCGAPLYSDPSPDELLIFLHALSYSADDGSWAYKTEEPEWAAEDWSGLVTPYHRPSETQQPDAPKAAFGVEATEAIAQTLESIIDAGKSLDTTATSSTNT
jgi:RluA family pseudouridine synthase